MNKYVGHESQLYCVEEHILVGGKGNGMRLLEVRNGQGLELTISLDRCGDISRLIYKGVNMSYMTPVGYVHPSYFDKEGLNFLKSFTAGFITTCGFNNVGDPGEDDGESLGLHGTISNTPCSYWSYKIEDNKIHITIEVHDEVIFAHKFVLTRNYYISLINNEFYLEDTIENVGDIEYPSLVLYHMNIGYPLLSEKAELFINADTVKPRNARALEDLETWNKILSPTPNFVEQCYFMTFKDKAIASIFNKDINLGLAISYDSNNLKCLTEWKMMGVRDYVLGLEPGNCYPGPRSDKRKDGSLITLKPNEKITYRIDVDCFDDNSIFESLKKN